MSYLSVKLNIASTFFLIFCVRVSAFTPVCLDPCRCRAQLVVPVLQEQLVREVSQANAVPLVTLAVQAKMVQRYVPETNSSLAHPWVKSPWVKSSPLGKMPTPGF